MKLQLLELDHPEGIESHSPFCLKIHRALQAAGLPYTSVFGTRGPSSHRKYNPLGQVPVLLEDGKPIYDSTKILRRITELAPKAFDTQSEAWLWEDFADTALNGYLVAARWFDARNWPKVRMAYFGGMPAPIRVLIVPQIRKGVLKTLHGRDVTRAGADALWERFGNSLDQLNARALENTFWLGEKISVADVAIFGQLHSLRLPLTQPQHDALKNRPALDAYLDRVDQATQSALTPTLSHSKDAIGAKMTWERESVSA